MRNRSEEYLAVKKKLEAEVLANQPSPRVEAEVISIRMRGDKLTRVVFRSRLKTTRREAGGDADSAP